MSTKAKLYIFLTALAGMTALRVGLDPWQSDDAVRFLCYFLISTMASGCKVNLPGVTGTMSVNFLFILIGIVELRLPETMLIAWAATLFQSFWKSKSRPMPAQILFNVSNVAVLITGETGSGKELVARAVHHYSLRHAKPWVDVNCAALPEHLMESELFGYEKGAFSGADSTKPGLFELANTGTLFLDEIGELDRKMQVKLLRVLDGTPYYRLGGVRKISVDVRVLSATNLNLEEAVKEGKFRSDLYHRLTQIQLKVPPLRERPDDIAALAEMFVQQQDPSFTISPEAMEALRQQAWPGNVRELRNVICKSLIFAEGPCIGLADLGLAVGISQGQSGGVSGLSLERKEREMVFKALAESGGHHRNAAKMLGISSRTLSRKLKIYGMDEVLEESVA